MGLLTASGAGTSPGPDTLRPAGSPGRRGHLAMLLFSLLVAGSFSLGSLAANEIAPAALNAVRFWIAAAVLFALIRARGAGGGLRAAGIAPWRYGLLGALYAGYFLAMFEGLKTAPPVSSAAVFTLTPLMSAGFGWLLLRQRMTPRIGVALALGAAGALWVIFRADLAALLRFEVGRGEVIFFFGCVLHAVYTPLVRVLNRGESALVFSFGVLVASAALLTLWGLSDLSATDWAGLPGIVWITILYTSVFASSATTVLVQFASLRLPASKVMAYTYLVPAWVMLWEVGLGGALPPPLVAAGVAATAAALALLLRDDG